MADEETPPESVPVPEPSKPANRLHVAMMVRAAQEAHSGFNVLRSMEAFANDMVDLGYLPKMASEIGPESAVGPAAGIDPNDLAIYVAGIAAIGEVTNANEGAFRKAAKRLAAVWASR